MAGRASSVWQAESKIRFRTTGSSLALRKTIAITGVGGLVGSSAAEHFHGLGYSIFGIDNDSRGKMLHDLSASTLWNIERLTRTLTRFHVCATDIRNADEINTIFSGLGWDVFAIIHTAAQIGRA